MASVRVEGLRKSFGDAAGGPRRLDRVRGRRDDRGARTVGLRQDHDAQPDRRLHRAGRRHDPFRQSAHRRRRARGRGAAQQARPRHGVPELRRVAAHDGRRQCRLWPEDAPRAARRPRPEGAARAAAGAARRRRRSLSPRALRRAAAARRARPRHRLCAADPAVRRAAVEPRCTTARGDARGAQGHPPRDRHHRDLRHPRSGGGDEPVRHASSSWGRAKSSRSARRAHSTRSRPTCGSRGFIGKANVFDARWWSTPLRRSRGCGSTGSARRFGCRVSGQAPRRRRAARCRSGRRRSCSSRRAGRRKACAAASAPRSISATCRSTQVELGPGRMLEVQQVGSDVLKVGEEVVSRSIRCAASSSPPRRPRRAHERRRAVAAGDVGRRYAGAPALCAAAARRSRRDRHDRGRARCCSSSCSIRSAGCSTAASPMASRVSSAALFSSSGSCRASRARSRTRSARRRHGAARLRARAAAGVDHRAHRHPAQGRDRDRRAVPVHHPAADRRGGVVAARGAAHRPDQRRWPGNWARPRRCSTSTSIAGSSS